MSNPYDPSPYFSTPIVPDQPTMFGSKTAHVLWVLLPIITFGLCAVVPFLVAAAKGVVRPWIPVLWGAIEIGVLVAAVTTSKDDSEGSSIIGLLLVLLIIGSATHTGLLDNERVRFGK